MIFLIQPVCCRWGLGDFVFAAQVLNWKIDWLKNANISQSYEKSIVYITTDTRVLQFHPW